MILVFLCLAYVTGTVIISRSIRVLANNKSSFFSLVEMFHHGHVLNFLNYSCVDGHFGCFHASLAVVGECSSEPRKADVSSHTDPVSLGYP